MRLPTIRGPLSAGVSAALAGSRPAVDSLPTGIVDLPGDLLLDEDAQLALWMLYELHYQGFDGVDDGLEWDPDLLRVRAALEHRLEADLRRRTSGTARAFRGEGSLAERIFAIVEADDGPSLARFLQREATAEQYRETLVHRSLYQLKEADPHTWVVPRIQGPAKVALVELQFDEYGAGRPDRQHARLFADGMTACGLDATYGAYVDQVPACTLALNNTMSLFGLHRRLRGAAVGHLAALEATSSLPCRRYVQGARRLGLPEEIVAYFDEHIEADAVHEQVAARDVCERLVADDPALEDDVLLGVSACLLTDGLLAEHLLTSWDRGHGSLRPAGAPAEAVA